jgi:hypothetical protein
MKMMGITYKLSSAIDLATLKATNATRTNQLDV